MIQMGWLVTGEEHICSLSVFSHQRSEEFMHITGATATMALQKNKIKVMHSNINIQYKNNNTIANGITHDHSLKTRNSDFTRHIIK